jgi:hypothetical protein
VKKTWQRALCLEHLEERAVPSVSFPDLSSGLDDELLSDPIFAIFDPNRGIQGTLPALHPALLAANLGTGQSATPNDGHGGQMPDTSGPQRAQFAAALDAIKQGNVGTPVAPAAAASVSAASVTPHAPAPRQPNVLTRFLGLNSADGGYYPPDSQAAAGPTVVINTVNQAIGIFDKTTGNRLVTAPLPTFFASQPNVGFFSDPVVAYDDNLGRFIVGDSSINTSNGTSVQELAISTSSNPATLTSSDWTFYHFTTTEPNGGGPGVSAWGDFPDKVGFNADAIVFTFNMFDVNGTFDHVQVDVINKSALPAGGGTITPNQFDDTHSFSTLTAASMHASVSGDAMYFLTNDVANYGTEIDLVELPNPLTSNAANFVITPLSVSGFGGAYGIGERLNSDIDSRMVSVATRNGMLVGAQTVFTGGHVEVQWYEIATGGTSSVAQEGDIASVHPSGDTYYPAIDIDPSMDLGVTFIESVGTWFSPGGEFPSMYVTGRTSGDAPNGMQAPVLAFAGTSDNFTTRGGDMATMAIDPSNGSFWACNEFITPNYDWNEGIVNFTVSPGPILPGPPASGFFFTDGNNQLWWWSANTNQYTDTGAYANQIAGGIDANGNPEVFFTDGNNQLWRWDNGTFTNTGAFALQMSAGQGLVAFVDGNRELWTFSDSGGFVNRGFYIAPGDNLAVGWDMNGKNLVAFIDGNHQLWMSTPALTGFTNTGAYATAVAVGRDAQGLNQIYFLDGGGVLYRYDKGQFIDTFTSLSPSGALAGSQGGVYFKDTSGDLVQYSDLSGVTTVYYGSILHYFYNSSSAAYQITSSPGTDDAFAITGYNQIRIIANGGSARTIVYGRQISAF